MQIVGDVGDRTLVASVIKNYQVDAIVHFAASSIVAESVADPLGYHHNNTINSHALIAAAVNGGVRQFIFSSTAAIYGNPASVPVTEHAPPLPLSPYGQSKLATEMTLRDFGNAHGLRHVIFRPFNVAGAHPGQCGPDHPRWGQPT